MDWQQLLLFAILGLGSGALIAGIALGIVLQYRGSGIINIATGAIAMVGGYSYWSLKAGIYGWDASTAEALVITLFVLLLLGVVIEFLAFRPLRRGSPLAKLAASLGVLLVAQAAVALAFGIDTKVPPPVLPQGTIRLFGSIVPVDRLILPAIVLFVTLVLSLLYRLTRFGLATRAASENEVGAMLLGLSPNTLALTNTLLATVVVGGLGILAASIVQLDSTSLPLQVVPALTAALFAGFTSFWIAALVGLGIGMLENILYYLQTFSWFPTDHGVAMPGVQPLLVFVLMVIALFVRGTSLPTRGELVEGRLPMAPRKERLWRTALIAGAVAVVALIVLPYDFRQALITSLLATIMCLSLVVITGFVGQISIVQLALAGVSGFIVSHLAVDHGIGFPWAMLIGAFGATALGLADRRVGAARARRQPRRRHARRRRRDRAVRLPEHDVGRRQLQLARARAEDLRLRPRPVRRVPRSRRQDPEPGLRLLRRRHDAAALGLFVANLRRSSLGQRMLAIRSNERAAAAAGVNVRNVKLAAFGISSFIAGIAGSLYGYNFSSVTVTRFSALTALSLIAFAYVGGITMVSGAIFAGLISVEALFPYALREVVRDLRATGRSSSAAWR